MMAQKNQNKTVENDGDVNAFIDGVDNDQRRSDAKILLPLFEKLTGQPSKMFGDSLIGYGRYHYKYASGREGTWSITGFSPRKANMTIYIMNSFSAYSEQLSRLGKHKHSKSCLHINKLSDVDMDVLSEIITKSITHMREKYVCD